MPKHPSSVILQYDGRSIHNDKILIYFFLDSLTRSTLNWYTRLSNAKIKNWKDSMKPNVNLNLLPNHVAGMVEWV